MDADEEITNAARSFFDFIRTAHLQMAAGDPAEARISVAEARGQLVVLAAIVRARDGGFVTALLLDVMRERISGLEDMVDEASSGPSRRGLTKPTGTD
jgi:hypothetical protein